MTTSDLARRFFDSIADQSALFSIFEQLPDVFFFVKNRDSLLIAGSRNMLHRLGMENESQIIGRPDSDFFPEPVVQSFHADDQLVFRTGKPLINRPEVWHDEQRKLNWFITTKVPLFGKNGNVVGLMGITRRDVTRNKYEAESRIVTITTYVRKHCGRLLSTAELARACGLSERSLFRMVRQTQACTPYELMLRIRVQKAAEMIMQTNRSILDIALDHGFCDQSTFTQHFRKRMGVTPKKFRDQYQRNSAPTKN